jgi:Tol biopolymer transport system component
MFSNLFRSKSRNRRKVAASNGRFGSRRIRFEALEQRQLLSVAPMIDLVSAVDTDSANADISADGRSTSQKISADGRYVVFQSDATNLVPGDNNSDTDIFLRDRQLGTTTLISAHVDGTGSANGYSTTPVISADGQTVAFTSRAINLDKLDRNTYGDIFVWNAIDGARLVSANADGTGSGNGDSYNPVISADGQTVAFNSNASNLDPLDTNTSNDIFVWDATNGVRLISTNADGTASGNDASPCQDAPSLCRVSSRTSPSHSTIQVCQRPPFRSPIVLSTPSFFPAIHARSFGLGPALLPASASI